LGSSPSRTSTGDRTILGKISKRGNRYLCVLFVQAAWVVLIKPPELGTAWPQALDRGRQDTKRLFDVAVFLT
jgi:transposase